MKKSFLRSALAVLAGGAAFLSGCGKDSDEKVLRMATEATFPPYESYENGRIVGIDVDIVREVAENLGYKLEIVDMKFDSVILAVQTGKCEIAASGITVTEDRKKQINFTLPYVTAAQVIVVPRNSAVKGPEDLRDSKIRIGVQQGTTGDTYVAANLHEPQRFDNAGLAVAALLAGKLDAVVCDSEPAKVHVAKHAMEARILPVALTSEEYAFAIAKKNVQLLQDFNRELLKMRQSGRLQEILDKYLNPGKKDPAPDGAAVNGPFGKQKQEPLLRVAMEGNFPPFEFFANGRLTGIDVDLVHEIATNLGYRLEIADMNFDSMIPALLSGKYDLAAAGITVTAERRDLVDFTDSYVTAAQVIVVRKESAIRTPEDLKPVAVRIGVKQGTTGDNFVTGNLHDPQRFMNANLAIVALLSGKLDAVVCDSDPMKQSVARHAGELKILPMALATEEYAFAVAKGNAKLLREWNGELQKMRKSGRLQEILDKYQKQEN